MSRLHRVTEEEIAAAELRLVTDKNLGRQSPAVVVSIAGMSAGDTLELSDETGEGDTEASSDAEARNPPLPTVRDAGGGKADLRAFLAESGQGPQAQGVSPPTGQLRKAAVEEPPSPLLLWDWDEPTFRTRQTGVPAGTDDPAVGLVQLGHRVGPLFVHMKGTKSKLDEAIAEFERLVEDFSQTLGSAHPRTLEVRSNLAEWRAVAALSDDDESD